MSDFIKSLRLGGELFLYYNLLAGNNRDQSGQGHADLTIGAGSVLTNRGLKQNSGTPSGVALDMSGIDEFTIFTKLQGIQSTGGDQFIFVFNRDHTTRDGAWAVWLDSTLQCWCGYYNTTSAAVVQASTVSLEHHNEVNLQFHVAKWLTKNSIKPYIGEAISVNNETSQDNIDGSSFASETLLVGSALTGFDRFTGTIENVGIHTRVPL